MIARCGNIVHLGTSFWVIRHRASVQILFSGQYHVHNRTRLKRALFQIETLRESNDGFSRNIGELLSKRDFGETGAVSASTGTSVAIGQKNGAIQEFDVTLIETLCKFVRI
ncbi:hypothetical protein N805_02340 [Pseudomonas putida S13.1.2]|uniref:Uncharacterized protein n=1 Tax=Pseudomonas putida S13.1.2 TaxID=1384061 RepID=A0AAU8RRD8_PSEPU|nr:hypothetical protein N805_02340 [Pseudomonas putida S13.1.2]